MFDLSERNICVVATLPGPLDYESYGAVDLSIAKLM